MPIRTPADPDIQAMSGIHVYYYFLSNCAQRVSLALDEKGLEWTPHAINLLGRENTKDAYLRINPKGLVPAMVHDGVVITESIDILRYIEEQFPNPSLYPSDPDQRRQVEKWMDEATANHMGVIKTYMYAYALGRPRKPDELKRYAQRQKDASLVDFHQRASDGFTDDQVLEAERRLFALFDQLESELSQHRWLVGDDFTYADIAWFVQYFLMQRTGIVNFQNYPNIRQWAAAFMQRPSFKQGIERLQPWYAPIVCQVLKFKSRVKRRGPAPRKPR